jgi:tetratricopeptide (TPR) repeat protein
MRGALVTLSLLLATSASAQPRRDQSAIAYNQAMQRGHHAASGGDWQAASDAYHEAASLRGQSGEAPLFLGYVARARGQLGAALDRVREAIRLAGLAGSSEDAVRAKALFAVAMVLESQRQVPEARSAWQEYTSFAESHSSLSTYVPSARSRIQMIDRVTELDQTFAAVRERIAARERENRSNR